MITPETLVRHELAGLCVRVAASSDPTLADRAGRVVDETRNTLVVRETPAGRASGDGASDDGGSGPIQVPKAACTFEFRLDCEGDEYVTVAGDRLVARPARRTERGAKTWQ